MKKAIIVVLATVTFAVAMWLALILVMFGFFRGGPPPPKPQPDPLAGWTVDHKRSVPQEVLDDARKYIEQLSPDERKSAIIVTYSQDGTGQHAIEIEVGLDGTDYGHNLIYDKNNKRVKILKYVIGQYRS